MFKVTYIAFHIKRHILAYVYGLLLRKSLDNFKDRWNSHRIRTNRVVGSPVAPDSILNELHTTRKDITFDVAKTL